MNLSAAKIDEVGHINFQPHISNHLLQEKYVPWNPISVTYWVTNEEKRFYTLGSKAPSKSNQDLADRIIQ